MNNDKKREFMFSFEATYHDSVLLFCAHCVVDI